MDTTKEQELVLEINSLSYSYDGEQSALSNINLEVFKGDYLGLIGPNGGGKTTLVKLILGLLSVQEGHITLLGKDSKKFSERYRIGYVSQKATDFDSLFPATVFEVASQGRYSKRGLFRSVQKQDIEQVENALARVGMSEYRDRRMSDLSGGQKQRVFIARALSGEPDLIILDEPTTGVDMETQEHFYELLQELNSKFFITLILVSHDLERIAREASSVAVVDETLTYFKNPKDAVIVEDPLHIHHH